MTISSRTMDDAFALYLPCVSAESHEARVVDQLLEASLRDLAARKIEKLRFEIGQIVRETASAAEVGSVPVDEETANAAIEFASLLPWSLPTPEVAQDADGEISFDWFGSSGKMFSVSVSKDGRIAYAGRFGDRSKVHGFEQLSAACPQEILHGISKTTA